MPRAIAPRADRKHHRHFHQNAHNRCQRRARFRPEQRDRGRDGQLKEIRSPDQRPWGRHRMLHLKPLHQAVSQARIQLYLQGNRDGDQHHVASLAELGAAHSRDRARHQFSNPDARHHAERHPDR